MQINQRSLILGAGLSILVFFTTVSIQCVKRSDTLTEDEVISSASQPEACGKCHKTAYSAWKNSHHALALRHPTDSLFRKLPDTVYLSGGRTYILLKRNDSYFLKTTDHSLTTDEFNIEYVIGVDPILQYVVALPKGKKQCLTFAFDIHKKEYFDLKYDSDAATHDWLHWTGQSMNWNSACADCHSTWVNKNYHFESDSFSTSYRNIQITCESCHGYVSKAPTDPQACSLPKQDRRVVNMQKSQLESCASCHSRRIQMQDASTQPTAFGQTYSLEQPTSETFYADGQIKGEVFEYHSFTQSKMYHKGVKCSDCHEPHSGKTLQIGNALCTRCHEKRTFDTTKHHFHPVASAGAQCINCHMPGKYYMERHYRHDHSLRIPRPDISEALGTPNPCTGCHKDKSNKWAMHLLKEKNINRKEIHFSDIIPQGKPTEKEIATLLQWMQDTTKSETIRSLLVNQLPPERLIEPTTWKSLANAPSLKAHFMASVIDKRAIAHWIAASLTDSSKTVRMQAAKYASIMQLPAFAQSQVESEYLAMLYYNAQSAGFLLDLGNYYFQKQRYQEAAKAYKRAIAVDFKLLEPYINLIICLSTLGESNSAMLYVEKAMNQFPKEAVLYFYKGLLLGELKLWNEAIEAVKKAIDFDPKNAQYHFNCGVMYIQNKQPNDAIPYLKKAVSLAPENSTYQQALQYVSR